MADYERVLSQNITDEIKTQAEKVLGVDTQSMVDITGYTPSKIIETLTKVVVENELYKPEYDYVLVKIQGLTPVINGIKSYDYMEYSDGDERNAREDNALTDFNAEFEVILREVFEVNEA